MTEPNFFIIGAQKAGTTYLARSLSLHPNVFFSEPKELMFFSKKNITAKDYVAYTNEHFPGTRNDDWIGEGSTTYLQWPDALPNLQTHIKGTPKFIICLRHPTEKAISFFIHNWRRNRYEFGTTITQALDMALAMSPLQSSLYAPSIKRWMEAYPPESLCFLKFDWLQKDPAMFVGKATEFLGIKPLREVPGTRINAGLPLIWKDDKLTIASKVETDRPAPIFTLEELRALHERFQDDIKQTAELTGLKLSHWSKMPHFA